MKKILLFGAGKSATVLIDYLLAHAKEEGWHLIVADANLALAQEKIAFSPFRASGTAVSFDIMDETERASQIGAADIVISMLPPALHASVARDCVRFSKNLLTASYVDADLRKLEKEIEAKGLLFLCEMGLDPGIDHMSAMKMIDSIHAHGGRITSFQSHCGGLVAPESDNNPWHYKISWNPRNIILAGKAGAHFREQGQEIRLDHAAVFASDRYVKVPGTGPLSWYPNRDSLSYAPLYGLEGTETFIRTTLRHPDFMYGWRNIIELGLTDETPAYDSDNKTLQEVFKEHLHKHGFTEWLNHTLEEHLGKANDMLEQLQKLKEAEQRAEAIGEKIPDFIVMADEKGALEEIDTAEIKDQSATVVAGHVREANLALAQIFFLGLNDKETLVNKGYCSPADLLQLAVEKKLALQPQDKDMIVMLHELEYETNGEKQKIKSSLVVKGENNLHTAMAKTVGLPLAIATRLILNGSIRQQGLRIPTNKEIYEPVLEELNQHGISFVEEWSRL